MKRWLSALCMVFLLSFTSVGCAANEVLAICGGPSNKPVLIPEENYGYQYYRKVYPLESIKEYYYLQAPSAGKYVFTIFSTMQSNAITGGSRLQFYVFDSDGEITTHMEVLEDLTQIITYNVKETEEIVFLCVIGGGTVGYHDIYFTVAFEPSDTEVVECKAEYVTDDAVNYVLITVSNKTRNPIHDPMVVFSILSAETPNRMVYAGSVIMENTELNPGEVKTYKYPLESTVTKRINSQCQITCEVIYD